MVTELREPGCGGTSAEAVSRRRRAPPLHATGAPARRARSRRQRVLIHRGIDQQEDSAVILITTLLPWVIVDVIRSTLERWRVTCVVRGRTVAAVRTRSELHNSTNLRFDPLVERCRAAAGPLRPHRVRPPRAAGRRGACSRAARNLAVVIPGTRSGARGEVTARAAAVSCVDTRDQRPRTAASRSWLGGTGVLGSAKRGGFREQRGQAHARDHGCGAHVHSRRWDR